MLAYNTWILWVTNGDQWIIAIFITDFSIPRHLGDRPRSGLRRRSGVRRRRERLSERRRLRERDGSKRGIAGKIYSNVAPKGISPFWIIFR